MLSILFLSGVTAFYLINHCIMPKGRKTYSWIQQCISSLYMKSSGPKSSKASSYADVSGLESKRNDYVVQLSVERQTHRTPVFASPSAGLAGFTLFFFPLVFSRASFCFSFASVVNPDAALRTSTSRSGSASARTWCSTKEAYRGLSVGKMDVRLHE